MFEQMKIHKAFSFLLIVAGFLFPLALPGCSGGGGGGGGGTETLLAPAGFAALTLSKDQIRLSWSDVQREEGYEIERSLDGVNFALKATAPEDATEYTDSGLNPETTYFYRIRAVSSRANDSVYTEITGKTMIAPPSGLVAMLVCEHQIDLQWTDASNIEVGFELERSDGGGAFKVIATLGPGALTHSDTDKVEGESDYAYRIRDFDDSGTPSEYSNTLSVTTPIKCPTNLAATPVSPTQIDLAWLNPSQIAAGFDVEQSENGVDFHSIGQTVPGTLAFQVKQLTPDTTYHFRVRSFDSQGAPSAYSNVVSSDPQLLAPTNLAVKSTSTSQIELTWTDTTTKEDEFEVWRSLNGVDFTPRGTAQKDDPHFVDQGLAPETVFHYKVKAVAVGNQSDFSGTVTQSTKHPAPSGLVATPLSPTQIRLEWNDNAQKEEGFKIFRGTSSTILPFLKNVGSHTGTGKVTIIDTVSIPETKVYYKVQAFSSVATSDLSNLASATPFLLAPTDVQAQAVSFDQIDVTFTDHSEKEGGFQIWRGPDPDHLSFLDRYPDSAPGSGETVTYSDTTVGVDETYYYKVMAENSAGNKSELSDLPGFATTPYGPFAKTYGGASTDYFSSVAEMADGNFLMAGSTASLGSVGVDFWLVRTDGIRGNVKWEKMYGSSKDDYGIAALEKVSDGFILGGSYERYLSGIFCWGKVWLIRLKTDGSIDWQKAYWRGGVQDQTRFRSMIKTTDGGFVVSGAYFKLQSNKLQLDSSLVFKVNNNGVIQYDQAFDKSTNGVPDMISVEREGSSDFRLFGHYQDGANSRSGLVRLNSDLTIKSQRIFTGSDQAYLRDTAPTADGGVVVVCQARFGSADGMVWLLKLDANSNLKWQHAYECPGNYMSECRVCQCPDGGYAVAGDLKPNGGSYKDIFVLKIKDVSGEIEWQNTYGGSLQDVPNSIESTVGGELLISGQTNSFGAGNHDAWLLKLDPTGKANFHATSGAVMGPCNFERSTPTGVSLAAVSWVTASDITLGTSTTTSTVVDPTSCTVIRQAPDKD